MRNANELTDNQYYILSRAARKIKSVFGSAGPPLPLRTHVRNETGLGKYCIATVDVKPTDEFPEAGVQVLLDRQFGVISQVFGDRDYQKEVIAKKLGMEPVQAHRVQHHFQALHARAVSAFPPLHSLISTTSRICVRVLLLLMLTTASGLFVTHQ